MLAQVKKYTRIEDAFMEENAPTNPITGGERQEPSFRGGAREAPACTGTGPESTQPEGVMSKWDSWPPKLDLSDRFFPSS